MAVLTPLSMADRIIMLNFIPQDKRILTIIDKERIYELYALLAVTAKSTRAYLLDC